jgi:hypothetical protein
MLRFVRHHVVGDEPPGWPLRPPGLVGVREDVAVDNEVKRAVG